MPPIDLFAMLAIFLITINDIPVTSGVARGFIVRGTCGEFREGGVSCMRQFVFEALSTRGGFCGCGGG
jgi:hypothetical protein